MLCLTSVHSVVTRGLSSMHHWERSGQAPHAVSFASVSPHQGGAVQKNNEIIKTDRTSRQTLCTWPAPAGVGVRPNAVDMFLSQGNPDSRNGVAKARMLPGTEHLTTREGEPPCLRDCCCNAVVHGQMERTDGTANTGIYVLCSFVLFFRHYVDPTVQNRQRRLVAARLDWPVCIGRPF